MVLPREAEEQEWSLFMRQNWGAGKGKEFLGKYFLWEKTEGITYFKVLLSPLTDIESPRQTARNTGTERIRLWWSSFRKSSLTGQKNPENFPELNKKRTLHIASVVPRKKKITQYALHSLLAIFVLITSEMCFM